jgi:hypothetical protein
VEKGRVGIGLERVPVQVQERVEKFVWVLISEPIELV